ncbi:pentapeptide repeat-containing protein [Jidongwangia harbinensis]|uniref:pentapeptide repeat-containing protein n=1 Tax=Jidongwangia harbinensis TaxID=2878561 RepID=UPI001CD97763|nr:pentapeptide repeat-containing protein [Jidongwangia harbinensis]MCA2218004.1 pentapeptide repeat-containing protein [Jidongwangia harbinensis]
MWLTLAILAAVAALMGYSWIVWHAPLLLVPDLATPAPSASPMSPAERATSSHNARLLVVSGGGALVVAIGLLYTARNYRLAHRGQVTDRFTKALEHLSSSELYVRVGGVHALTHVLRDSPSHHTDVLQVLVAFVRHRAPRATADDTPSPIYPRPKPPAEPDPDVQAALTAIVTRPRRPEYEPPGILYLAELRLTGAQLSHGQLQNADLSGAQLQNANLREAQLQNANLRRAQLQEASLMEAQLQQADLFAAQLQRANLPGAQLQEANLVGAQLQEAYLEEAQLQRADLSLAQLQKADLLAAQLQEAKLIRAQLRKANLLAAQLQQANLAQAQLQQANLAQAQLHEAHLDGAKLFGTRLQEVVLHTPDGADAAEGLNAAQLATAEIDEATTLPTGMREALQVHREWRQRSVH